MFVVNGSGLHFGAPPSPRTQKDSPMLQVHIFQFIPVVAMLTRRNILSTALQKKVIKGYMPNVPHHSRLI